MVTVAGWLMTAWGAFGGVQAFACDNALLEQTRTDLGAAKSPDFKLRKLAGSLAESCSFPKGVRDALANIPSVDPSARAKLEQKAVLAEPQAWTSACAGGTAAFEAAFGASGSARSVALFKPCDMQRYKFTTEAEFGQASGLVFLSLLVAKHFEEQSVPDGLAIPLLRGLAGIPEGVAPAGAAAPTDPWVAAKDAMAPVVGKAFEAMSETEWASNAGRLLVLCETLRSRPSAERMKNRQVEFDTCAQAGRAADNVTGEPEPLYRSLAGTRVNWGYYLAGAVAKGDPTLVSLAKDATIKGSVGYFLQQITSGGLPMP